MTTYSGMAGYRPAYDYDDDDDELDPERLHPNVRRQARRIVHHERMSMLLKWWISTVGAGAILCGVAAVGLTSLGLPLQAVASMTISALLTIYLIGLAHRPPQRA